MLLGPHIQKTPSDHSPAPRDWRCLSGLLKTRCKPYREKAIPLETSDHRPPTRNRSEKRWAPQKNPAPPTCPHGPSASCSMCFMRGGVGRGGELAKICQGFKLFSWRLKPHSILLAKIVLRQKVSPGSATKGGWYLHWSIISFRTGSDMAGVTNTQEILRAAPGRPRTRATLKRMLSL